MFSGAHVDLPVVYENSVNLIATWSMLSRRFKKLVWRDSSGSDSSGEVAPVKLVSSSARLLSST